MPELDGLPLAPAGGPLRVVNTPPGWVPPDWRRNGDAVNGWRNGDAGWRDPDGRRVLAWTAGSVYYQPRPEATRPQAEPCPTGPSPCD